MKFKSFVFASLAVVSMTISSCTTKTNQPAQQVEEESIIPDSVFAFFDNLEQQVVDNHDAQSSILMNLSLCDEKKLVKPDYLYDLNDIKNIVSSGKKARVLGMLITDYLVAQSFDMDNKDRELSMGKISVEINFPIQLLQSIIEQSDNNISSKVKELYQTLKSQGQLIRLWQFELGSVTEMGYIFAQDPQLYLANTTDEQWNAFTAKMNAVYNAMDELAKYDEEIASYVNGTKDRTQGKTIDEIEHLRAVAKNEVEDMRMSKTILIQNRNALLY